MGRGTFKYICEDCEAENWLTTSDRDSRFRPHCVECGSTWLNPSHGSKASDKLAEASDASHERTRMMNKKMEKNKE